MKTLCGIDEAGRGPLAGPLVMAGVILTTPIDGLNDSKRLTPRQRESLYDRIRETARCHIVSIDADTIDKRGLSGSLILGLKEIMAQLTADEYLFDGNTTFGLPRLRCQIKADLTIPEVSAASILAKVTRDRYMTEAARQWPQYGFENHKGYGTREHLEALQRHGPSPLHRKSFRVKSLQQPTLF